MAGPGPTIVTWLPLTVTTDGVREEKVTGDPESVVALIERLLSRAQ